MRDDYFLLAHYSMFGAEYSSGRPTLSVWTKRSDCSPHDRFAKSATFHQRIFEQMSMQESGEERGRGAQQDLRAAVEELEAKLNEIAALVAHVRHEINNPLTGVIGQAQLLLREELSPTARRRVETIEQLAGRIRDTVAQLREVQRPQLQSNKAENDKEADAPPRH
jgi:signal transduction histidine kinase